MAPKKSAPTDPRWLFANSRLPKQVGVVENLGLQLPAVSPDGKQMLYLRLDAETISPRTLLGSADPADTPPTGTLEVWLRPVRDRDPGQRLSTQRWAHSPVWSKTGRALAYVVNDANGSQIVHMAPQTEAGSAKFELLGVPDAVNCMPRFDDDDNAMLFASAAGASGPFRIYRQVVGQGPPVALSPPGRDCLLPALTEEAGSVQCALVEGDTLQWVRASPNGVAELFGPLGDGNALAALAVWNSITEPVSPGRKCLAFFEPAAGRIGFYELGGRSHPRQRDGSMAACWMTDDCAAIATADGLFIVNAFTGVSLPVMSGQWIPARFVPESRTLIVLGKGPARNRLSVFQIVFEPPAEKEKA